LETRFPKNLPEAAPEQPPHELGYEGQSTRAVLPQLTGSLCPFSYRCPEPLVVRPTPSVCQLEGPLQAGKELGPAKMLYDTPALTRASLENTPDHSHIAAPRPPSPCAFPLQNTSRTPSVFRADGESK